MLVDIRLLGDFSVQVDGETVELRAQKAKALLAWLACHEQPQSRDRLVGVFWADGTAANGKASLRQALTAIRRQLPNEAVVSRGEYVQLDRTVVSCDAVAIRDNRQTTDVPLLKSVLEGYRGDLLDGLNAKSAAFDEWLLVERENLRQVASAGFARVLDYELTHEQISESIATCGRLLSLDPLQEEMHRQLMRLYANNGQLGAVRRQFKLCRDTLQRELNSPPSHETVALLNSLTQEGQSASEPAQESGASRQAEGDRRAALPSIAVLPFRSMSENRDHAYLADGMTEELINLLGNSANWQVSARNVSFQYRDKETDARTVGRELGVGYVVDGSIRTMGDRLRVSATLVGSQDGIQIWSERYDRSLTEIFDVQDEVVHAIFRTLKNRLGFAERERVRRTPKTNLDAWSLLIKAMQVNVIDAKSQAEQIELVREAIAIEPNYPRAHAYLASLIFTMVGRGTSRDRKGDAVIAGEHAEIALAGGSTDTVVLKMCAGGLAAVGQSKHALALAERAYELTGSPDPLLVAVLMWNGRIQDAIEHCQYIVDHMPANVPMAPGELRPLALLGNLHMLQGEYEKALEYGLRDQRHNPANFFAHVNLANVHGYLDQVDEARAAWALATSIVTELTVRMFAKGYGKVFADPDMGDKFSAGLRQAGLD